MSEVQLFIPHRTVVQSFNVTCDGDPIAKYNRYCNFIDYFNSLLTFTTAIVIMFLIQTVNNVK